jgi:ferric-dicitrate binding protein FerR (iron transport regulator)
MNINQYNQLEDFLLDDAFVNWVQQPSEQTNAFWKQWMLENPDKEMLFEEAQIIIKQLKFKVIVPSLETRQKVWAKVEENTQENIILPLIPIYNRKRRLAIAASLAGLIALGAGLWVWWQRDVTYQTAYGETKIIELPDGSKVTLNTNSTIRIKHAWNAGTPREVWLEGEAFFKVIHQENNQKFVVHTQDQVNVEVLGTEFDVLKRESKTEVFLKSGKVRLTVPQVTGNQEVIMKPGDLAVFKNKHLELQKAIPKDTVKAIEWTKNRLVFDNITVEEMVVRLREMYGLEVEVSEKELLQKRIWGTAPINNVEVLFLGLSKTFDWKIDRQDKKVFISKR